MTDNLAEKKNYIIGGNDDLKIFSFDGRIDSNTSVEVNEVLTKLLTEGCKKLIWDFTNTYYLSSAGIRVILVIAKTINSGKEGFFGITNMPENIKASIEVSGLTKSLNIYDTIEKAKEALASKGKV